MGGNQAQPAADSVLEVAIMLVSLGRKVRPQTLSPIACRLQLPIPRPLIQPAPNDLGQRPDTVRLGEQEGREGPKRLGV